MDSQKLKEKVGSFAEGSGNNSPDPEKGVIVPSKTERIDDGFKRVNIYAPAAGTAVDQKDIPDVILSSGVLGHGMAIDLFSGHFHSYVAGTLEVISKTKNAYIIKPKDTDLSVFFHVGIDTSRIPEELHAFSCDLKEGTFLKVLEELGGANLRIIKEQGKSLISPILVQNENMEFKKIIYYKKAGEYVNPNELIMSIVPVK